jgi:hypothetical protein
MDRDTSWRQRVARRIEAWIGLAALAGSAWMFSTMSEATTVAAQDMPAHAAGPAAPQAGAQQAGAQQAAAPLSR